MKFAEKLKELEGQYIFMKYAGGSEYGKLVYVGEDFFQFDKCQCKTYMKEAPF